MRLIQLPVNLASRPMLTIHPAYIVSVQPCNDVKECWLRRLGDSDETETQIAAPAEKVIALWMVGLSDTETDEANNAWPPIIRLEDIEDDDDPSDGTKIAA